MPYLKEYTHRYTEDFVVIRIGWRRYLWEKWLDCCIYGRHNYASRKEPVNPADEWIPECTQRDGSVPSWAADGTWMIKRSDWERQQAEQMEEPI